MVQWSGWVGAGLLTAGVSAALLAGTGVADAETGGGSDPGPAKAASAGGEKSRSSTPVAQRRAKPSLAQADPRHRSAVARLRGAVETAVATPRVATRSVPTRSSATLRGEMRRQVRERLTPLADTAHAKAVTPRPTKALPAGEATEATASETPPQTRSLLGQFGAEGSPLVRAVGSAVFNAIGGLIQAADGPPVVPPGLRDSVRVSSSTLVVSPGNEVPADWYFPTQGEPQRMIYLQHGFLASGPMYSYTASYLAERTNSVVVVTTVTSNPYAEDGMWLGGDNMHKAVAQLFLDPDREALNASMSTATLKAGQETFAVPQRFVLVGHSLGGGFAPGVAGYYAEGLVARRADGQDAPNELAGVILLDGVPPSGTLTSALDRLAQLEASNGNDPADYVPVYELGAPANAFNSTSTVNGDLATARPGKFNGVVVDGGVHMDSMLGGNPLIQFAAYLVAGIPQPQNPPAVQWLMAGWVNDMFEGNIDPATGRCLTDCNGIYGDPGDAIDIDGDRGNATAVVLDSGAQRDESSWELGQFIPVAASFIPASVLSRLA
ncbi:hypothetical protein [Mycobacterium sp. URHD0025]|uniref:hypothetical protein n=1 Tax=Mycobacterium sp. URHD0025 TaxID=1298864 RepID=UPI0006869F67|nr:hypothetical protein [Mycobacterium sp. URHD0025]